MGGDFIKVQLEPKESSTLLDAGERECSKNLFLLAQQPYSTDLPDSRAFCNILQYLSSGCLG